MALTFHHALFGYDGGHQLLVASLSLPTDTRHFLAVATDMSGSAPAEGFNHSYTGAPVPGTNFYALFCTWLAPEMPRPGCVWSHVLLLDLADIAELRDLGTLRRLFLRPATPLQLEHYSRPLLYPAQRGPTAQSSSDENLAPRLLAALYGEPQRPVVVPAAAVSPAHEDVVFALWSQQWPRLRRNFRFSTGSFADRGRGGPAFDLQITPEANRSAWPQDGLHIFLGLNSESATKMIRCEEAWVRVVLDDLLHPDAGGFRSFLHTFGADVTSLRAALIPFARIHSRFGMDFPASWMDTLRAIATEFPAPEQARTLKQESVATPLPCSEEAKLSRLMDCIGFLCVEDTTGAFAQVGFDFEVALRNLWSVRRQDIADILSKPPLTEVRWTALANAVAVFIETGEMSWLFEVHPELLVPLIRLNPRLATAPSVWELPDRIQWAVVEALEAQVDSVWPTVWCDIIRAKLTGGNEVAAREIAQHAGPAALETALKWLVETHSTRLVSPLWREVLRPLAEERLAGGNLTPHELAFCAAMVPPPVAAALPATRSDIQELAVNSLNILPAPLRLPTAFLLCTLGLQASEWDGAALLARGFFPVLEALDGAVEPPEAWRMLQPHLPTLWFWEEWDRCLKLRRGLENWLRAHPNALDTILEAATKRADRSWLESLR